MNIGCGICTPSTFCNRRSSLPGVVNGFTAESVWAGDIERDHAANRRFFDLRQATHVVGDSLGLVRGGFGVGFGDR